MPASRDGWPHALPLWTALVLAVVVQVAVAGLVVPAVWSGEMVDNDSLMRLQRVLDLHAGGGWFDPVFRGADAPFGFAMHWTRPLDALLYAGAVVLAPLTGAFRSALVIWGSVISPLLLLSTLVVLSWGLRPVFGRWAILPATGLLLIQPQLHMIYVAGRPDHHSLMGLLFAVLLAVLLRAAAGRTDRRHAWAAGLAAALSLWVSTESLVACGWAGAVYGLSWVWDGSEERRRDLAGFAAALAVGVLLALLLEHAPGAWTTPLYDRLSVVHLVLAAATAVPLIALSRAAVQPSGRLGRLVLLLLLAGALPMVVMLTAYPAFFAGPLAAVPPDEAAWQLDNIGEVTPLLPGNRAALPPFLFQLGLTCVSLAGLVLMLWRGTASERRAALVCLLGLLAYLPLALAMMRWASYTQVLAVVPLLYLGQRVMQGPPGLRVAVVGALVGGPYVAAALVTVPPAAARPAATCDWAAVQRVLVAQSRGRDDDILYTYVFVGPGILWTTGYRVVGAPYFHNTGVMETQAAFSAMDDAPLRAAMVRRGATWLLVCGAEAEGRLYHAKDGESLHDRLVRGVAPDWLRPVALPPELEPFRLYRRSG